MMGRWIRENFKEVYLVSLDAFWMKGFEWNTEWCKCSALYSQLTLFLVFFSFLNWKFISKLRFNDTENIERNSMAQPYSISSNVFRAAWNNGKIARISVLNAKDTIMRKKSMLHSLFISVLVYTILFLILFELPSSLF